MDVSPQPAPLEARIRAIYENLTGNEARLADIILAAPGEVATHTATELSRMAQISGPTTTRFFRKLGYESYDEARKQAREAQRSGSPLYLRQRHPVSAELQGILQSHLQNEIDNLTGTYGALDPEMVLQAVKAMASARRLVFIGYRHSLPIATMLYRNLLETRGNLDLLPARGDTLAEHLVGLGPEDFAVCIGLRRRVPELTSAMAALGKAGVPMLYLADVISGPPARHARHVIRCHTKGLLMFDSVTAVAAVANLLYSLTAREILQNGSDHLEDIEILHSTLHELE